MLHNLNWQLIRKIITCTHGCFWRMLLLGPAYRPEPKTADKIIYSSYDPLMILKINEKSRGIMHWRNGVSTFSSNVFIGRECYSHTKGWRHLPWWCVCRHVRKLEFTYSRKVNKTKGDGSRLGIVAKWHRSAIGGQSYGKYMFNDKIRSLERLIFIHYFYLYITYSLQSVNNHILIHTLR